MRMRLVSRLRSIAVATAVVNILLALSVFPSPSRIAILTDEPTATMSARAKLISISGRARLPAANAVWPISRPIRSISSEKYMLDAIMPIAPGMEALKKSLEGLVYRKKSWFECMTPIQHYGATP